MSDSGIFDSVSDTAKLGGSVGAGGLLALLAQRLFGGQDRVLARLETISQELVEVRTQLAVLISGGEHRDQEVARLRLLVDAHSTAIARLEAHQPPVAGGKS